jgi:hypothetical protein
MSKPCSIAGNSRVDLSHPKGTSFGRKGAKTQRRKILLYAAKKDESAVTALSKHLHDYQNV